MFQTFFFILGLCDYSTASKAFIFSFYNAKGYNPVKLTQYRNHEYAMYSCSNYGPTFGAGVGHDIYISDNALDFYSSYTKCGASYTIPSGYSAGNCGFFTGGLYFTPTDIEVFYEIGNEILANRVASKKRNPHDKRLAQNSLHFVVQSEVETKPIPTRSLAFSRASPQPLCIYSWFDWFTRLFVGLLS